MINMKHYSIVIAVLVICVSLTLFNIFNNQSESYEQKKVDKHGRRKKTYNAVNDSPIFQPVVGFLERRLCRFPDPDYGQYTFGGCRCSRVGTPMSNGTVAWQDTGLFDKPL